MRAKRLLAILASVVAVAASAVSSDAAVLPVGAGSWSSNNVTQSAGCTGIGTGSLDCLLTAKSNVMTPTARETCSNASFVIRQPVVVGTDFGCRVEFHATLRLTGTGTGTGIGNQETGLGIDIEVGACAGLTLSDAYVNIHDAAVGDYRVYPRVVVTSKGWKFQGNLVAVDATTSKVVVLNTAGSIIPGCKRVKARRGETSVTFSGVFSGTYTFL